MGNHEWDDEKIEQLLSNAPKIKDERPKEDILARLKKDPRLNGPEKKKKWTKLMPVSISAAAIVTLTILVSSFYNGSHSGQEVSIEDSAADISVPVDLKMNEDETTEAGDSPAEGEAQYNHSIANTTEDIIQPRMAVYPFDLEDYREFRLALSSQAEAIPVTFLISKAKIAEDFTKSDPSDLELYRKYTADINENAFGFSEYHPMVGEFKEENGLIIHTLPKDHPYDLGGATESEYFETVKWTFEAYDRLEVLNEDGTQAEFAHVGPVEPEPLTNPFEKVPYYLYTLEDNQQLLVPWTGMQQTDLQSTLEAMKVAQSDYYQPLIPESINFTVTEEKGVAYIKFDETLDLQAMDLVEAGRLVDGILLTAASFDMQAKFENVQQPEWNGFDFTKPLPKPIGPNPFYLNS